MKMLGHQHVADDFEMEFAPQDVQGTYKLVLEALRIEKAGASIRAAREVMQMIQSVIMFLP